MGNGHHRNPTESTDMCSRSSQRSKDLGSLHVGDSCIDSCSCGTPNSKSRGLGADSGSSFLFGPYSSYQVALIQKEVFSFPAT